MTPIRESANGGVHLSKQVGYDGRPPPLPPQEATR